jgi:RNA polymerase sigma-70 factor (ECF subfamily)
LLLDKLTPIERAAYILREAFDYPYREIADVLRLEEANARQGGYPRSAAGCEWRKDVGESDRAATSSRRSRCCGPEW